MSICGSRKLSANQHSDRFVNFSPAFVLVLAGWPVTILTHIISVDTMIQTPKKIDSRVLSGDRLDRLRGAASGAEGFFSAYCRDNGGLECCGWPLAAVSAGNCGRRLEGHGCSYSNRRGQGRNGVGHGSGAPWTTCAAPAIRSRGKVIINHPREYSVWATRLDTRQRNLPDGR